MKPISYIYRGIATFVALTLWGWLNFAFNTAAPLISGRASLEQLNDSDTGYFVAKFGTIFNGTGLPTTILFVILLLIWLKPITRAFRGSGQPGGQGLALLLVGFLLLGAQQANAYFDDKDQPEFIQIKTNQTVFMVTNQGKNLEGQAAFDSEAYLEKAKVSEKRIQIPHQAVTFKGAMFTTYTKFIPASTLYIVTREPYVRQWCKEATRGTSAKDQGFYLESKESLNIDFGVSIAARIQPKDATKYLFFLGCSDKLNAGDNGDYPSVQYARDLADVMDNVVHQRVQIKLAREFGKRTLDECIAQKAEIMEIVKNETIADCANLGITVDDVGYASQLNEDPAIQEAINKVYVAHQNALAAVEQMKAVPALTAMADIAIKQGIASAASKWNGDLKLPSFVVITPDLVNSVKGMFGGSPAEAKK